jgi:hypothetical protein
MKAFRIETSGLRKRLGALLAALVVLAAGAPSARAVCVGDCNGDDQVSADELIGGVRISLGEGLPDSCAALDPNGDGVVSINELILGVNNALNGCPVAPTTAGIVFSGENNRLHAYDPSAGFPRQTVIPSSHDDPVNGLDINAQICFTRDAEGNRYFIAGEDTNQNTGVTQGWGYFRLEGERVGEFSATEIGKLVPTYQPQTDNPENYGCGFSSDGRLFLGDVGDQASGDLNGQLIVWFPPFDRTDAPYCKIDYQIGTAQQITIEEIPGEGDPAAAKPTINVYIGSARGNAQSPAGIYRYRGAFPTGNDPASGCGRTDPTGAPLVDEGAVTKELFIPADQHVPTPVAMVFAPGGGYYVSSVLNGVIAQYDADRHFVRNLLSPPAGSMLPYPTGTPLGLGIASDGTIYYADIGLTASLGPGNMTGTVRRLRIVDGEPQPPETMDTGLDFPDGIGILGP